MKDRVLVGAIAGAHGVRGEVRIRSFTHDPAAIGSYGPVFDESGARQFDLTVTGAQKNGLVARLGGVTDRNAAEALRGTRLYVPRAVLPPLAPEEFYHADLIGLAVETLTGESIGRVRAVQNHGAGDLLQVERPGQSPLDLPFTRDVVPLVDEAAGRLVVDLPPGLLELASADAREDADDAA